MYYIIEEKLNPIHKIPSENEIVVAIFTEEEWEENKSLIDFNYEHFHDIEQINYTKAEVFPDFLYVTLSLIDFKNILGENIKLKFYVVDNKVIFIDNNKIAENIIKNSFLNRKWRNPSLERFIYDFFEIIIENDIAILNDYEKRLSLLEENLLDGVLEDFTKKILKIRKELLELRVHYEQLIDVGQELQENENGFFNKKNLNHFKLFTERVERLQNNTLMLRDFCIQIREEYKSQIDLHQNKIMQILTVVTTIFFPLTLIVGWYGMNFIYMPELNSKIGYPGVIIFSILIVIFCIWIFKKKKFF